MYGWYGAAESLGDYYIDFRPSGDFSPRVRYQGHGTSEYGTWQTVALRAVRFFHQTT
jgi:hypothetical protein